MDETKNWSQNKESELKRKQRQLNVKEVKNAKENQK